MTDPWHIPERLSWGSKEMIKRIPHTAAIILSATIIALTAGCQENDPAILEKAGIFYEKCMNNLDEIAFMTGKLTYLYDSDNSARRATRDRESFTQSIARAHHRYMARSEGGINRPYYKKIRDLWQELLNEVLDEELKSKVCPYPWNRQYQPADQPTEPITTNRA